MISPGTTYQESGVDIEKGDDFVEQIKPLASQTKRKEVISPLGGYAGLFSIDLKKFPDPVLVSTTDGVGTKLKLAFELNQFDTIGIDLVAMCVNDLICCGAEPLFFLDYFATGKLETKKAVEVVRGITGALQEINCTLIGGETAEMPGFYQKGEFDIAGFAVGIVNRDRIVDGQRVCCGDTIIGLASSGVHSNGYSLVRKILEKKSIQLSTTFSELTKPIGLELLTPTKIYVTPVLNLLKEFEIRAMAHITGGGIEGNLPRVIPNHLTAVIEKQNINTPSIFRFLQKMGQVPEEEMWKVFNMGIGLMLVVQKSDEKEILKNLKDMDFEASPVGKIRTRKKGEEKTVLK